MDRQLSGVCESSEFFVDDRVQFLLQQERDRTSKIVITARSKSSADACYNKAKEMIIKILAEEQQTIAKTSETYKGYYDVVEEGDKVFRSPKHGQVTLEEHHPNCRIKVCDRTTMRYCPSYYHRT